MTRLALAALLLTLAPTARADRLTYQPDDPAAPAVDVALTPAVRAALGLPAALPVVVAPPTPPPPATAPATAPATTGTLVIEPGEDAATIVRLAAAGTAIQFRRGGTWRAGTIQVGADNVSIGATPGPGPLPRIRTDAGAYGLYVRARRGVTIRDLDLAAAGPAPLSKGVYAHGARDCTIERCRIANYAVGVAIERYALAGFTQAPASVVVRDCLIADNYNPLSTLAVPGADSQGLYADECAGLTIEGCVLDHNGWSTMAGPGAPSKRNHNVYVTAKCSDVVFRGNASTRASNFGAQVRCGGTITGNLFVDNLNHLSVGYVAGEGSVTPGGVTGEVSRNVILGGRTTPNDVHGEGIMLGNVRQLAVHHNVIGQQAPGGTGVAVRAWHCAQFAAPYNAYVRAGGPDGKPVGVLDLAIANNVVWQWSTPYAASMLGETLGTITVQPTWPAPPQRDLRGVLGATIFDRLRAGEDVAADVAFLLKAAGVQ